MYRSWEVKRILKQSENPDLSGKSKPRIRIRAQMYQRRLKRNQRRHFVRSRIGDINLRILVMFGIFILVFWYIFPSAVVLLKLIMKVLVVKPF